MQDGSEAESAGDSIVDSSSQNTGAGICSGDAEADGGLSGAEGQPDGDGVVPSPSAELQRASGSEGHTATPSAAAGAADAGHEVGCDKEYMLSWLGAGCEVMDSRAQCVVTDPLLTDLSLCNAGVR